ncbi:hypothetical protein ACFL0D_00575 [Thermoproteota archaeon]
MKLSLVAKSPFIETMIATSMLTTTSGAMPSTLFNRLLMKPKKVNDVVGRIEVQHGNILEHNRLIWKLEASKEKVLDILLRTKFFNITKVNETTWVLSGSLRTLVEYHQVYSDEFSEMMVESIKEVSPHIHTFIKRDLK